MSMPDFATRSNANGGFCSPTETANAIANPDVYVLDVRTDGEIASDGKVDHVQYVHSPCSPDAAPELEANAEKFFPEKSATILVYCKSGRRASKAKAVLQAKGYACVLNAGGYIDVQAATSS